MESQKWAAVLKPVYSLKNILYMKKSLLLLVTLLASLSAWAATPGEIGTPVVTLTQNAEDNTKLDVAITCENAKGIVFTFNGDDPTLNSPNFVDGYQIDLTQVPSPVTVKAVGYDAEYNLGEVGSASFTLAPIEITFDPTTTWFIDSQDVTVTVSGTIGQAEVEYLVNGVPVLNATGEFTFTETSTLDVNVRDERAGGEVVTASETYMLQICVYGSITFGAGDANTQINAHEVIDEDDLGNTWTITTVGTTSYTQNSQYSQVGSSSNPAQSITFTMTLPEVAKINHFQAEFGGISGTEGHVTLKVDDTEVGSGDLIPSDNVIVGATQEAVGRTLTIMVTNIAKGVKVYVIGYGYEPIQPETVNYLDENRETQSHEAIVLTGDEITLGEENEECWYVAKDTLNYTQTLNIAGDVHLILANGAVMNIGTEEAPVGGYGIDGSEYYSDLTIYGQTLDDDTAGHLNINTDEECIYVAGDYAQHSGNVTANSSNGCGFMPWDNFTFTGGTLYVTAKGNAIYPNDNVDILGGKLSAVSVGNYYGINSTRGVVTFGWKSLDDEYTVSSFAARVKIADGQAFTDGENIYDSTTPKEVFLALTNVTLRPVATFAISLPESFEHGMVICDKQTAFEGETVTLTVTPDNGYELDNLTVTFANEAEPSGAPKRLRGGSIELTPGENGTYTFQMPAAPVTVNATFKETVVTGVEDINAAKPKSDQRYNMLGQRVGNDYKGIVIENGRKRVIK